MPRQNPLADAVEAALLRSGGPFAMLTNPDGSVVSSSWSRASMLDPGIALGVDRSVDRVTGRRGDRFVEQFRSLPAAPAAPAPASPPRGIRRARGTPVSPVAADDLQSKIDSALRAANSPAPAPAPDPRAEALQLAGIRSALAPGLAPGVRGPMKPRQRPEPIPDLLAEVLASRTRNPRKVALPPPRPVYYPPERLARIRQETMPVGPVSAAIQGLMSIFGWNEPEGVGRLQDQADEAAARGDALGRATQRRILEEIARLRAGGTSTPKPQPAPKPERAASFKMLAENAADRGNLERARYYRQKSRSK